MSAGELGGRVALVTGTGRNIGGTIARALADAGAAVACNDLHAEEAQRVAAEIVAAGGAAIAIAGDVANAADVEALVARTEAELGTIDILVNNAASRIRGGTLEIAPEDWSRTLDTVLTGTLRCTQAVARRLVACERGGAVVNMSSADGHRGAKGAVAYCAAKGGLLNLTRAMAVDLAPHKIRVNSISPTRTGSGVQQSGRRHDLRDDIPLERLGEPDDIADAVCFLVSERARFITGVDLPVDGGSLARLP